MTTFEGFCKITKKVVTFAKLTRYCGILVGFWGVKRGGGPGEAQYLRDKKGFGGGKPRLHFSGKRGWGDSENCGQLTFRVFVFF